MLKTFLITMTDALNNPQSPQTYTIQAVSIKAALKLAFFKLQNTAAEYTMNAVTVTQL